MVSEAWRNRVCLFSIPGKSWEKRPLLPRLDGEGALGGEPQVCCRAADRSPAGPCLPPGPHVLRFHHVRPGWAPPSPHSLVRPSRACQAQREALGQSSRAVLRRSWGIKPQASGDSGIRLLSPGWRGGQGDLRLPPSLGDTTPPEPARREPPSKKSQGHLTLGPLAPSVNLASQPGDPLLQPRLSSDPRLDPALNLGSPLLCLLGLGSALEGGVRGRWEPQGRWSLLLGPLLCSGGRQHGMEVPATAAGSWCGGRFWLETWGRSCPGLPTCAPRGGGYPALWGRPRVPGASVHLAA